MEFQTDRPIAYIDFEYNQSNEPNLNLVCCSLLIENPLRFEPLLENFWLHGEHAEALQRSLCDRLNGLRESHTFVAYAAAAEARSFLSLKLDPHDFQWIDLYAEWRQIQYNNNRYLYGRYMGNGRTTDGEWKRRMFKSVVPSFDARENRGKDNRPIELSLAAALCCSLGIDIDTDHKDKMRDLILSKPVEFADSDKQQIMDYCASDITHLSELLEVTTGALTSLTKHDVATVREWQILRGQYAASLAKMEQVGMPIDVEAILNLSRNHRQAVDNLVTTLNENHYEFYIRKYKNRKDLTGYWVRDYSQFEKFLREQGLFDKWPRTEKKRLSTDGDTLKEYEGNEHIEAFRQVLKSVTNISWFREEAYIEFMNHVGSDNRLRPFLGGFGTQTGRNAPRAKTFPFAMANWLRCIVHPEKGLAIVGNDYANQEFIIGAVKSKDQNMIAAYLSGDPYLDFAKKAGAIPTDGTIEMYPEERMLFKTITLAIQYGMGIVKLAITLSNVMGREVTEKEAARLKGIHKRIFREYWRYQDHIESTYKKANCLILSDGWILGPHCDRITSVKNFPIQGLGASIMRRAVYYAQKRGVDVMAPLHDAIYAIYAEGSDAPERLAEAMQDAVNDFLPGTVIRQDESYHRHGEPWVESRGAAMYKQMSKYLEWMESDKDVAAAMDETIFA